MIKRLCKHDIGLVVWYKDGTPEAEMGVVKKYDNKLKVAWVVYSCAGDWLNYQNYTAEATGYADLTRDLDTKEG